MQGFNNFEKSLSNFFHNFWNNCFSKPKLLLTANILICLNKSANRDIKNSGPLVFLGPIPFYIEYCYFSVNLDVSNKYIYNASFNDFVIYFFFCFLLLLSWLLLLLLFSYISSKPNLIHRIFPPSRSCISTQPPVYYV